MKFNVYPTLSLSLTMLFACQNQSNHLEIIEQDAVVNDSIEVNNPIHLIASDTIKRAYQIQEERENLAVIEKKYGEQWDFCKCIVTNDSVNKAIMEIIDFDSPEAKKVLDRSDFVDKKCQILIGQDANRTPEERERHAKKVRKCLKNGKT